MRKITLVTQRFLQQAHDILAVSTFVSMKGVECHSGGLPNVREWAYDPGNGGAAWPMSDWILPVLA